MAARTSSWAQGCCREGVGVSPIPRPVSRESEQPRSWMWMENPPGGKHPRPPSNHQAGTEAKSPRNKVTHRGHQEHRPSRSHADLWGAQRASVARTGGVRGPGSWLLPSAPSARAKPGAKVGPPQELSAGSECLDLPLCLLNKYLVFPSSRCPSPKMHLTGSYTVSLSQRRKESP